MYGLFDVALWLARVVFALLRLYGIDLAAVLATLLVAGCTLVYVPARTTWTVQAGEQGAAATVPPKNDG